jgi:hypothetical protein
MSRRRPSVAKVINRNRKELTRLQTAFARQNYLYAKNVSRAYENGATATPAAPRSVVLSASRWRDAVGDVLDQLDGAVEGSRRTAAIKAYTDLDRAIGHTLKALAARSDVLDRRTKAVKYMDSFVKRNARLERAIR